MPGNRRKYFLGGSSRKSSCSIHSSRVNGNSRTPACGSCGLRGAEQVSLRPSG
ncbi:Uncharacterised protein [Bordetella pertussis]|nr:Uncharacterised protein [Bordetella pertussis]